MSIILGNKRLSRREELQYWRRVRKWQVSHWTKLGILGIKLRQRRNDKHHIRGLGEAFANMVFAGA